MMAREAQKGRPRRPARGEDATDDTERGDRSGMRRDLVLGELYDHAARLFATKGYAATTLQDIAATMGMQRPSLYHYVRSKEDLLAGLVAEVTQTSADRLDRVVERKDLDASRKLEALVRSVVESIAANPTRFRLLDSSEHELPPELAEAHLAAKRTVLEAFMTVLRTGIRDGRFRPLNERIAALS